MTPYAFLNTDGEESQRHMAAMRKDLEFAPGNTPYVRGRTAARYFRSLAAARGDLVGAAAFIENQPWLEAREVKAAVLPHSTSEASRLHEWPASDFIQFVRPQTLIGRLPLLRRVPFTVGSVVQIAGARSAWVDEAAYTPVTAPSFSRQAAMPVRKVTALAVLTDELARLREADYLVAGDMSAACIEGLDSAFVDGNAGDAARPGAINHGALEVTGSGNVLKDADAALQRYTGAVPSAAWLAHPRVAAAAGLQHGDNSQVNVGAAGGVLAGIPMLTSESMPTDKLLLIDQKAIELAGADSAELRVSQQAAVWMSDDVSGTPELVSLWQTNCSALLAEIPANWRVIGPSGSVVSVTGATYPIGA